MSGRRERTTKREERLDPGLRRYVPDESRAVQRNGPSAPTSLEARAPMATPRRLGEVLLLARQGKGIDLERAARDTKIRSRYLAALEAGDLGELPGTVYTKGFLRNYAQYLGLDPDAVIAHYKREYGSRASERVAVVVKTLRAPRAGIILTRGLLAGIALTLVMVAFAGYVALQFLRFAQPPTLAITRPSTVESSVNAESTTLAGTASAGATVTISGPDGTVNTTASAAGTWSAEVPLRRGIRNEFLVIALDLETGKKSAEAHIFVRVPPPAVAQAPVLSLSSPADGTTFTNGAIPIVGTTSGSTVSIAAAYLGPPGTPPAAVRTPAPPPVPDPAEIPVDADGSFSGSYELTTGSWKLTVTATGVENKKTSVMRTITVAYTGVNVVVEIKGGRAWLLVRIDGSLSKQTPTESGRIFANGTKLALSAKDRIDIRTGVASITYVTVNGVSYGPLGPSANPGTWTLGPDGPPQPL